MPRNRYTTLIHKSERAQKLLCSIHQSVAAARLRTKSANVRAVIAPTIEPAKTRRRARLEQSRRAAARMADFDLR